VSHCGRFPQFLDLVDYMTHPWELVGPHGLSVFTEAVWTKGGFLYVATRTKQSPEFTPDGRVERYCASAIPMLPFQPAPPV